MKSVFNSADTQDLLNRIDKLSPDSVAHWGKMSVSQMLAHCNVSYELIYENKHPKPNFLMKLILKLLVKDKVVSDKPYKHNLQTAPVFLVKDDKDFATEKSRLINYINKTQHLGETYFDGKESHSFGVLSKQEWNNMLYKHLDHHLSQFGV
ncbi:DUF1569 domain-containing protein [Daejeonella oryzae]|uniref:DUF1569 domain-containing protein n=1 Tax=Daejeonella oryzae TaxID=1122943 RepID=UPI0003F58DC7|nr:DUF1569 domain-containing protein [Daejeonella oryzae]